MMPIDYGFPLTQEEREVVIGALVKMVQEGRCHEHTPSLIRQIGWPQRRIPDLRGFLMKNGGAVSEKLEAATGKTVGRYFFVSRTQLWFVLPGPGDCRECGSKSGGHKAHCLAPFLDHERRAIEIVRSLVDELSPRERAIVVGAFVALLAPKDVMKFTQACQWAW